MPGNEKPSLFSHYIDRAGHSLMRYRLSRAKMKVPTIRLGSDYGGYIICSKDLTSTSIVYSFGLGEDISFDLSLIEQSSVHIHAFDPTPRSLAWLKTQQLPPQFHIHPVGLADYDGMAQFRAPANPNHVSHTMVSPAHNENTISVPVRRLSTIMTELGHARIDLLKMDIEGAEYQVLEDISANKIKINQLLLEFHPQNITRGYRKTRDAIITLQSAGFMIFDISENGNEYSFIRVE
jgi:FkbM family methyltransferase